MQPGSLFFAPLFFIAFLDILLGAIVVVQNKSKANILFAFFCLSICLWTIGIGMFGVVDLNNAYFWNKEFILTASLIAATFLHFIYEYIKEPVGIGKLFFIYLPSVLIFISLLFFPQLLIKEIVVRSWGKESVLGIKYVYFGMYYIFYTTFGFCKLYLKMWHLKGVEKQRYKFILIATSLTSSFGGYFNLFLILIGNYRYIWVGPYCSLIMVSIISYAIVKYRLMDIKIVFTRASIFVFVYAFILGVPIWIGWKILGKGMWLLPVSLMGFFATLGPFIYLFFQKRAEDRLLQEQRRYQNTLRQASAGMGKIKDLKKLLNMIVYVLTHAIQIEHAIVYIYNENQKQYVLGASKRKSGYKQFINSIEEKSSLVQYLLNNRNLIIFEEIKQRSQDYKDLVLVQIVQVIFSLEGELLVPIFIDQDLTAIIVMGKKESGKPYTEDDLGVFSILANQTALAIENAKFYEDMKLTQKQLFQAEKMATIGTMADGLSHQINNRFHALGFIAGDALDTIQINKDENSPEKLKEVMTELERGFSRVQENVKQGGEIVQGLLKYTRKGESGFTAVNVDEVFKAALEMVQFKIKTHELKIVREYDIATMPKVKGNFTQLQEVFFNLIDNGYDAMMQRKTEAKEKGFQPTLIVKVSSVDNYAQIIFEDNGIGVKEEDVYKLFTPFFTTKLSSKKGTGLGLYVIKKIVEDNHNGQVEMVSKYMHGTQMKLRLPIAIG